MTAEEQAREGIRQQKLASLPTSPRSLPSPSTAAEFDQFLREWMSAMIGTLADVNTVAMKPCDGISEEYRQTIRMSLYEICEHAHAVWESTFADEAPDGRDTFAGRMMRIQRQKGTVKGGWVQVLLPGDPGYDEVQRRIEESKKKRTPPA